MSTHLDVLREIAPEQRATLHERSDRAGLQHLASYAAVLLLCSLWIANGWIAWQFILLPQGLLLVFLFTLQHECTHETPFRSPVLSRIIGHLIALILAQPFIWFRYFHLAHHRYTNDPENDPELLGGAKPEGWWQMILYTSGLPTWRSNLTVVLRYAFAPEPAPYLPARALPRITLEARFMLLVYALAGVSLLWSSLVLWLWIIPALIAMPFLRIYLLAEHGRCPYVANMLENTRTTYTTRLVRWLAWNMPYHIEHHSAPNVPFHKLPALHAHMHSALLSTSNGYREFAREYVQPFKSAR
ncbi:fatty acid desaturase [Planktotalea sp.]|uniref:fatty acid desaturase n=1 Tax=Planktotalea sp. TaxID=2029877 RepID=UPI003D6C2294